VKARPFAMTPQPTLDNMHPFRDGVMEKLH
jgi:hypothetical protein